MTHFYIVRFKCVSTQLASTKKWFEQFLLLLKKVSKCPLGHQVKVTGEVGCIQDRAVRSAPGFTWWQWSMVVFSQPWPESFTGINIFRWAHSSFHTPRLIRRDVYPSSVSLVCKKFCIWQVLNCPTLAHNSMKFLCGCVWVCVDRADYAAFWVGVLLCLICWTCSAGAHGTEGRIHTTFSLPLMTSSTDAAS